MRIELKLSREAFIRLIVNDTDKLDIVTRDERAVCYAGAMMRVASRAPTTGDTSSLCMQT